jgi:type I restriction enzyme M protein
MYTKRLEASVIHSILTQLDNLGWVVDEKNPLCNVTQQRAKTEEQKKKLKGKIPDVVLYQQGTDIPIGVIEAKRPGQTLQKAMKQAEKRYANPLRIPLILTYNDTYIESRYLFNGRPLKIDGEDIRQFFDHYTALRFVAEGSEILSAPKEIQYSREQLIKIFKHAADLLRKAGLQAGTERFGAFSDILFLKLMDEKCELELHAGRKSPLPDHIRWSHFKDFDSNKQHNYVKDVVWNHMNKEYGTIFGVTLPIDKPLILSELVNELSQLNLTAADTDVKGDSFEYFLKNAYQGLSIKDLGEYFTPRNIVRTMVSMVNPKFGEKIYDPFCGTGGFLIETLKYIRLRIKADKKTEKILKEDTIFGSEITTNARIAKMNMILAGDGHSNIVKEDSLENPKRGKYDIVVTNVPFSQRTDYGNLYKIPTTNGDAICVEHCFDSLSENGRAAILVKENFVSDSGDVGKVRKHLIKNSKSFSVVSLPRKLFIPYTPTKTSIIYFEKAGKRKTTFFYIVKDVGHTLSARKKNIKENDLPLMLDSFNSGKLINSIDSCIVDNEIIKEKDYSLWVYDFFEIYPESPFPINYLGNYIEERIERKNNPWESEENPLILGISNKAGVFDNDTSENKQKYKRVYTGDLVYNPHRINVGSLGIVTDEFDKGYVSGIYVVFKSTNKTVPPEFILKLLKSKQYLKVIEAYDTKYGAVRANLTYEMLCKIKIPILSNEKLKTFLKGQKELNKIKYKYTEQEGKLNNFISDIVSEYKVKKTEVN